VLAVAAATSGPTSPGTPAPAVGTPRLSIMALGDSITQANASHQSYRYALWRKLVDANFQFDFVGSLNTNYRGSPSFPQYRGRSFDPDHEGHWGKRADELVGLLDSALTNIKPDIVLLHAGSNDLFQGQNVYGTMEDLKDVIRRLQQKNPDVKVLLAKLIPSVDNAGQIRNINRRMQRVADATTTNRSRVIVVDQYSGFDAEADTYDGTHPNTAGEEKMATRWFEAITAGR
jgi:acyl-CoA thioesterase I